MLFPTATQRLEEHEIASTGYAGRASTLQDWPPEEVDTMRPDPSAVEPATRQSRTVLHHSPASWTPGSAGSRVHRDPPLWVVIIELEKVPVGLVPPTATHWLFETHVTASSV
jgi:hypothetical protein